MNCQFCNLPCTNARDPKTFYCKPCYVTFVMDNSIEEDTLLFIELWAQLKDKKYMVRLFPNKQTTELRSATPTDPTASVWEWKGGYFHEVVLELDYLADITPQNVNAKVQTMLTFL